MNHATDHSTQDHIEAIRQRISASDGKHPMIEALSIFLQLFSSIMLLILAEKCKQVSARGFGEVVIEFKNGKPKFIKIIESEALDQHERQQKRSETRPPMGTDRDKRGMGDRL